MNAEERKQAEEIILMTNTIREVIEDYDSLVAFDHGTEHCILPEHYDKLAEAIVKKVAALKVAEVEKRMPTEEAERCDAEDYLNTKDIWNHPMVSDRINKNGYEVADLMAEFANVWFRSRMEGREKCQQ